MVARLQRRTHFNHLRAHGTTVREGRLRITCAPPDPEQEPEGPGVAFAIPRSFGPAVRRNRARRRLRAIISDQERSGNLPQGWFLVNVLPCSTEPDHRQLQAWFNSAVAQLNSRAATAAVKPSSETS